MSWSRQRDCAIFYRMRKRGSMTELANFKISSSHLQISSFRAVEKLKKKTSVILMLMSAGGASLKGLYQGSDKDEYRRAKGEGRQEATVLGPADVRPCHQIDNVIVTSISMRFLHDAFLLIWRFGTLVYLKSYVAKYFLLHFR